jgi:hypothetical protein
MVDPLGVLQVGPAASTTEFEEGVNGGAPGGATNASGNIHHRV